MEESIKNICKSTEEERNEFLNQFEVVKEDLNDKMEALEEIVNATEIDVDALVDYLFNVIQGIKFCGYMNGFLEELPKDNILDAEKTFKDAKDYFGNRFDAEEKKIRLANEEIEIKVKDGYHNLAMEIIQRYNTVNEIAKVRIPDVDLEAAVTQKNKENEEKNQ